MTDGLPDFIHAGVNKSASTWLYRCLGEHPEVSMPETDSVKFFNANYFRGIDWYKSNLKITNNTVVGEATPSYLMDEYTPVRMHSEIPDVKLIFVLRNPVDRAYSQWWHGWGQNYWTYEFDGTFDDYVPFQIWAKPGFYGAHLDRFLEYFDENQMKILLLDDLKDDDEAFIREIYEFIGVDRTYRPSELDERTNTAVMNDPMILTKLKSAVQANAPESVIDTIEPAWMRTKGLVQSRDRYEEGMADHMRKDLEQLYAEDCRRLETILDRDLDHWFEFVDL